MPHHKRGGLAAAAAGQSERSHTMASNVRKFGGGKYLIVARMFGCDIPLITVTGYDWAEKQAQRLQARTGYRTFIRSAAPAIDARAAEVVPATGVEIVEVV